MRLTSVEMLFCVVVTLCMFTVCNQESDHLINK